MFDLVMTVLEQGLIFGILTLGVFMTYRILNIPDLSVDGTIVLGAAITGSTLIAGVHPVIATILAMTGGALAGLTTGLLHVKLKISSLLSGILVMLGLYSINLRIMGIPNLSLFRQSSLFILFNERASAFGFDNRTFNKLIVLLIILLMVKTLIDLFLNTKLGMLLRTTGDNEVLVTSLGASIGQMKIIGLMISNALVALSGSLLAQYQRFTDINSGVGTLVIGLASVIIGHTLLSKLENKWLKSTTVVIFGAIVYKSFQALTLQLGFNSNDFKLISALLVVIALGLSNYKGNMKRKWLPQFKKKEVKYVRNQIDRESI